VASDGQTARLPIDTPKNVVEIGNRKKFRNVQEAAQSAIAKSGGTVIPISNIRDSGTRTVAPSTRAATPTQRDLSGQVCQVVFILQAAKFGHTLTVDGKTYSIEQVRDAAPRAAQMLDAAIKSGRVTQAQVKECVDGYCRQASCALPSQTGTSNVLDQPAAASVNEAAPARTSQPPLITLLPPPAPRVALTEVAEPAKKSHALWWLVALIGGGLLIKKLASVKVVGAAVAGVPLVAELSAEEDEEEEEDEESETDSDSPPALPPHSDTLSGPPEAHQIED
jgi:hypothetical protein